MKVKFLHILPLMAAVMLATSCNNNDNDPVTPEPIPSTDPVVQDDGEKVTIPYTIQVGAEKKKTTKMQWKTGEGENLGITWDFSDNEVELKNKLTVTGEGVSGSLDLVKESGNYYFTGSLTAINATVAANLRADQIELTGIYGTALSKPTALRGVYVNESLSFADFVLYVAQHPQLKGTFHFSDENIILVDQQIYLHIIMSPCQHKITINGTELGLPKDGDGWVVLPATSEGDIDLNFLKIKASDLEPGKIYTIDRRGWVDLGLSDGTLWADKNYGANEIYKLGDKKNIFEAWSLPITLPTGFNSNNETGKGTDIKRLWDECYWEEFLYTSGISVYQKGFKVYKSKKSSDHGTTKDPSSTYDDTDPFIFFPIDGETWFWNACNLEEVPTEQQLSEAENKCKSNEDEYVLFKMEYNVCAFTFYNSLVSNFDGCSVVDDEKWYVRPILRKNQKPAQAPEPPTE